MRAHRTEAHRSTAVRSTVEWRRDRLLAAGVPDGAAAELAEDRRTDLHAVLDLIDRGCPPALAARILAPLDGSGRRAR
jgi:hypothetical protein